MTGTRGPQDKWPSEHAGVWGTWGKKCLLLVTNTQKWSLPGMLRSHRHSPTAVCGRAVLLVWLQNKRFSNYVLLWVGDLVAGDTEEISKFYFLTMGSWKFISDFSKYILTFTTVNKMWYIQVVLMYKLVVINLHGNGSYLHTRQETTRWEEGEREWGGGHRGKAGRRCTLKAHG